MVLRVQIGCLCGEGKVRGPLRCGLLPARTRGLQRGALHAAGMTAGAPRAA